MHAHSFAIAVVVSLAAASLPGRAEACSCSPEPIYHAQPKDGAGGVPRDIAPVLEGAFDPAKITLEDEHGAQHKFALNLGPRAGCLGGFAELIPEQPLAAHTRYTIRVPASHPDALAADRRIAAVSFTTGSDELADGALRPPQLTTASILRGAPDCGGARVAMACIGGLERNIPKDHELIVRRGDKVLMRTTKYIQNDANYGFDEQPDCIELRRRAPDGRRSEPTTVCGSAILTRDYAQSDKVDGWVQCKDGILGDPNAYDDGSDAGAPKEPEANSSSQDAGAPRAATEPDGGPRHSADDDAAFGCSIAVHDTRHSGLQLFSLAGALVVGALRRRRQRAHSKR